MAVSEYDKQNLSSAQQSAIDTYTKQWEAAKAAGDTAGMQAAHDAAEAIRSTAGYSGGSWGNSYNVIKAPQEESDYALTDFLRQQNAANTQKNLVALKDAYERNMATYKEKADNLPQVYEAGRNSVAAQDAIARKNFDERAVANGLNTGTTGQAELARESTYRGQLADLDREQANANAAIERQQATLQAEYENAIAAAKAGGNADLANALYQELIRVENLEREDAANQQAAALAEQQNAQNIALKYGLVNPANIGSIKGYDDLTGTTMGQYLLNGSTGTGGSSSSSKKTSSSKSSSSSTSDQDTALKNALVSASPVSKPLSAVNGALGTNLALGTSSGKLTYSQLGSNAKDLLSSIQRGRDRNGVSGITSVERDRIVAAINDGRISQNEANAILDMLGV